jgi:phosphoserine phosphatase
VGFIKAACVHHGVKAGFDAGVKHVAFGHERFALPRAFSQQGRLRVFVPVAEWAAGGVIHLQCARDADDVFWLNPLGSFWVYLHEARVRPTGIGAHTQARVGANVGGYGRSGHKAFGQRMRVKAGTADQDRALAPALDVCDRRHRPLNPQAGRIRHRRVDMAKHVVRHIAHLLLRWPCGQDLQININLHGVHIDDLAIVSTRHRVAIGRFARRRGAKNKENGLHGGVIADMGERRHSMTIVQHTKATMPSLVLVAPNGDILEEAIARVEALWGDMKVSTIQADEAVHISATQGDVAEAIGWLDGLPLDISTLPPSRKRLMLADMDSTIIGCECLDELADFAGKKAEVSAITERAMAGELDFEGALTERVAMLAGLPLNALQACYDERVRLNEGATTFVRTMAALGGHCALVSGGFTFFTSRVAEAAGFHTNRANTLNDDGAVLTGSVALPILGKEAKLAALNEDATRLGMPLSDTLAIGDGANDLMMIEAAGLGIAYYAKPVVAARAPARIDHGTLESALFFQGIGRNVFVG